MVDGRVAIAGAKECGHESESRLRRGLHEAMNFMKLRIGHRVTWPGAQAHWPVDTFRPPQARAAKAAAVAQMQDTQMGSCCGIVAQDLTGRGIEHRGRHRERGYV